MTANNLSYLTDMLNAAKDIQSFLHGLTEEEFKKSKLHQSAVIHQFQILGEAAQLISDELKASNPQIPWQQIAGMRNRLIHEYFRIDLAIVWSTSTSI